MRSGDLIREQMREIARLRRRVERLETLEEGLTRTGNLTIKNTAPQLKFRETDVAVDASGLWRTVLTGGKWYLEKNTAAAGDFSTVLQALVVDSSAGVFINETANANMTIGLTINQGGNDDGILALKSSDVAHGGDGSIETDTYGSFSKVSAAGGGLVIHGLKDANGPNYGALSLTASMAEDADTTKSNAGLGIINISTQQLDGAGAVSGVVGDGNIVSWRARRSGGTMRTVAILDEDGDLHLDATLTQNAWDDHDDLALLHGLRASMMPAESELRRRFGHFIEDARPVLEEAGIVHYNDGPGEDGSVFIAMKKWNMLLTDALRQLGERNRRLETKVERLEQKLLAA